MIGFSLKPKLSLCYNIKKGRDQSEYFYMKKGIY